ncbi:hypothetical protein [Pedobacter zeae]|uniref:Uncharacterized protein n=1 Tax=Pedobacter zeae TaxID=1737356 RepID=A0A7W6K947_9SPHI|nr:hypothetical protein [Pedobacter zeae]MBB4107474.1 hypothetical protein [Pedobacter zeae]GGG99103.1 hypothetical protein GCM10007422_11730 [Pedobacter zeae]
MDNEKYYIELIETLKRATVLIDGFKGFKPNLKDPKDIYLYDVYLSSAILSGGTAWIDIIRKSNLLSTEDEDLNIEINDDAGQHFTKNLYEAVNNNKSKILSIIKEFDELSHKSFLDNLLVTMKEQISYAELSFIELQKKA